MPTQKYVRRSPASVEIGHSKDEDLILNMQEKAIKISYFSFYKCQISVT